MNRETIGDVELVLGDYRDILPVECDAVVTDPPYGIKRFRNGLGKGDRMINKADSGFNNNPPSATELAALISLAPFAVIFGMNNLPLPTTEHFLVWDKEQTVDNFASAELAWCNLPTPAKVFRYSIHKHNQRRFGGHPTEKPVPLIAWCLSFLKEGCTILDPFAGSGTTAIACIRTGRKCICIEKDEHYYEVMKQRVKRELAQGRLL